MKPLGPTDPQTLGAYRLLGRLGTGGMGQVFLARTPDGRTVAVKLIHPHFAHEPEFRRRFRQEVAAAQRVAGEWTAPVLDSDTEAEIPWLATGFVPGPSLTHVVDELHGPLPGFSVWRLAEGLARALTAIHAAGVTHRDLKPSNVLLTLDGPRVIDFGIARAAEASMATRTGVSVGSPGYMAPEQVRGERSTEASDVFGLGAVLAYAATGTGPFGGGDSAAHALMFRVVMEPPRLDGLAAGPLRELVERCLAKEPADRPSPAEIAAEAARHDDPDSAEGVWLPPTLTARLGREAAGLLALEGPSPTTVSAVPPVPTAHNVPTMTSAASFTPPPPGAHPSTTISTPPLPPPVPASRRRGLGVVVGAALAVVAVAGLVYAVGGAGEGDGGDGQDEAADVGTEPEDERTAEQSPPPEESGTDEEPADNGSAGPETAFDFTGTWEGTVDEGDGTPPYDVIVEYSGGEVGEQVATVDYTRLECGGTWTLREATDYRVDVLEHLTFGQTECVDEVDITLTPVDENTLRYSFVNDAGFFETTGSADLRRG
ncbi:serine/threonine-protein kinase [Streptomyces sp. NBC_01803]|uniref:serine/threonine-protein kinase n=1 Tax=Streptomyces sp. NBC_01803 TaxID=2975946 RepID=UPI002DDA2B94|nr:serine/threonine-protein kinase [Streptomyces sp. NBC_01803]WSA43031.1 serine/threonine protein kinase [Streptomyces sp. NBC_01803]